MSASKISNGDSKLATAKRTDIFAGLPVELRIPMMTSLSPDELSALRLSSRVMNDTFRDNVGAVCHGIMTNTVGVFLPMALMAIEAEKVFGALTSDPPYILTVGVKQYTTAVAKFAHKHLSDTNKLSLTFRDATPELMVKTIALHQAVQSMANELAETFGSLGPGDRTATEWHRLQKCVYLWEAARTVIGYNNVEEDAIRAFWDPVAPWEAGGMWSMDQALLFMADDIKTRFEDECSSLPNRKELSLELASHYDQQWASMTIMANILGIRGMDEVLHCNPDLRGEAYCKFVLKKLEWDHPVDFCLSLGDQLTESGYSFIPSDGSNPELRQILDVAKRFPGREHDGPRDLLLWQAIYHRLPLNSPLTHLKPDWRQVMGELESLPGPCMEHWGFQDRRFLEAECVFLPMEELIAEAEHLLHIESLEAELSNGHILHEL
ncbi:hypothetical protein M426DRAFT_27963 [Hypoxylon sp. CI-4A]|nr:hypothetical protein M426DRAFT_27963 [Hypoxylon sp. CI-4A]